MTKGGGFPLGPRGHDVPNLHLTIVDNHSINEQFYQLATLGDRQLIKRRPYAVAEGFDSIRQSQDIHLLVCLRFDLPQLMPQTLLRLCEFVPFPLKFLAPDHFGEIDVEQAGVLPLELGYGLAEGPLARLQGLWEPRTALGSLEFVGDQRRLGEHLTQILPDQRIQSLGLHIPGKATLTQSRPQRVGAAPTKIIARAGLARAPRTS